MIFFRVCSRGERERERERGRVRERERESTELTAGVNFVFGGFLDRTIRGETREPRSAGERSLERQSAP